MKTSIARLNKILEAKTLRAIDRLETLKAYTTEFDATLNAIVHMLEINKDLDQYDIECPDCNKTQDQMEDTPIVHKGKKYVSFYSEYDNVNKIVLFYSNGCQPCQYFKPILESFVNESAIPLELVLVDEPAGMAHAQQHQIQGWPTLFVVKNNVIEFVTFGADINGSVKTTKDRLTHEVLPFFR